LPAMIERGGPIINVTSDAWQVGYPGWGAYGISKFGLEGMSQTWASELQESVARVTSRSRLDRLPLFRSGFLTVLGSKLFVTYDLHRNIL